MQAQVVDGQKMKTITALQWGITIVLPIIVFLFPITAVYTAVLRTYMVVTLFVILLFAFELLPTLISALLLPALYVIGNVAPFSVVYSPWTQSTVSMVLGGFLIANICSECGVLERMSYWMVKKCKASYLKMVMGIFCACLAICLLTFGNGFVIGVVFCYALCKALHLEGTHEGGIIMTTSVLGGAFCNHMVYNPLAMGIALPVAKLAAPDLSVTPYDLFLAFFPLAFFCLGVLWLYTKFYKIPKGYKMAGGEAYFDEQVAKLGKISLKEKKAAVLLVVILAYMLLQPLHHLPIEYAFMVAPLLAFFPGINLGTMDCIKKVPFEMLFFVTACAAIGMVGMNIGLGDLVSVVLLPIMGGMSNSGFLIGVFMLCGVVNFLMTPLAMMSTLPVALITMSANTGIDPAAIVYSVFLGGDLLAMPYESANYLIMFSFGVMTMKDFVVTSVIRSILLIIFFAVILLPYWHFLGFL